MDKILVTGGAGFIGSHVCDALLNKGKQVVCLDNFNNYYSPKRKRKNIEHNLSNKSFFLEETDIRQLEKLKKVFEKHKITKVIHLAARAGVRASIKDPHIYEEVNVKGTLNLLELSRKFNIKNFVFGSSSSVYGLNKKLPFSEKARTDTQISPYALTKKTGEMLCHTYSKLYKLNITCLRFFTVYGPRGRPDMAPYLFTKLISEDKPIIRYGDGSSKRDYTYIEDVVQAILSASEKNYAYEIFNIGNSKTIELNKFISLIETLLGKKARIIQKDMPKEDIPITYADISKAKKYFGYNPKTNIEQGMKMFVDWFNKNES